MSTKLPASADIATKRQWLRDEIGCSFLAYGYCQTLSCMKRGGWTRGCNPANFTATCQVKELDGILENLEPDTEQPA